MIMSAIIIASSILMRSIQTTVLSLKNYNIALFFNNCALYLEFNENDKEYQNSWSN